MLGQARDDLVVALLPARTEPAVHIRVQLQRCRHTLAPRRGGSSFGCGWAEDGVEHVWIEEKLQESGLAYELPVNLDLVARHSEASQPEEDGPRWPRLTGGRVLETQADER